MKVNLFKKVTDVNPTLTRDVSFFLDRIKNGNSKALISRLRSLEDKKAKNTIKLDLPAVTFNGTFTKRGKDHLKEPSGLMTLDFDDFQHEAEAFAFKEKLKTDCYVLAAWISPSMGVKALYRIMNVKDDAEFKKIYSEVAKKYSNLDPSGKDISRLCFESYDPEIYVNIEAQLYSPVIVVEDEINNIGTVTNIPITDEDIIVNRILTWFEKDIIDNSNLNTSIFILCSALNRFGVSSSTATEFAFRYAKKEAPEKEVHNIVRSAYKNTAEHGTKSFEDSKSKKKLHSMVASGKTDKEITKAFKHVPEEKLQQEVSSARKTINPEIFWEYDFHGVPKIKPYKLKIFLESQNYLKYYPDNGSNAFIFISKDDNFLDIISEYQIKDYVLSNLQERFEIDIFDIVAEKTKLFTYQYLSILDTANVETMKDSDDFAMLYYRNIAVKVKSSSIEKIEYSDLDGYVWRNNIINRNYEDVDHHKSQFRSFVWLIAGQDRNRYNTFKSVIGYLLHSYKNSANNKAIVLNDEKISDNPNGGSGKGLLTAAIGKMKNLSVIDGKTFDFAKAFPYQTVATDTQVLSFDDARKNFQFEKLFSLITEGITLEYKGKDAIKLSVEDSPKILISTNYTIKSEGGSFERRMFEVELSNHFNQNHSPKDEFGNMLFDGWDEQEWQLFDKFMINCLQYYLTYGLVPYEHINLEVRKLINSTSREFIDFMETEPLYDEKKIDYKSLRVNFSNEFEDYKNHKWFTQKLFNTWLGRYIQHKGFDFESISSGGVRYYVLKAVTDEAKKQDVVVDINSEVPF